MALRLDQEFDTPYGSTLPTTYWRWVGLGIDVSKQSATGVLYAYVSEDAYNTGKQPIGQRTYDIKGVDFAGLVTQAPAGDTLSEVLSNAVYKYVKTVDPFFSTAEQV